MFYEVSMNTELGNMKPLLLGKYKTEFLQVSTRNMFITRLQYNLLLFVFLSKDPLMDIYCEFTSIKLLYNGTEIHA